MSFLSGLGNIFHSIGNFFGGGDDNSDPRKRQDQQQFGSYTPPTKAASFSPAQNQNNNSVQPQPNQPAPPALNLYQGPQKAFPTVPGANPQPFSVDDLVNGTLKKAQANPQPAPQPQPQPAQPGPSVASRIGHFGVNLVKSVAQPFVNTGEDVSNAIGNAEVGAAHALGLAKNIKTQTNQEQFGDINNAVGLPTQDNNLKNFATNVGQVGLTVLAPEADAAAATVGSKVLGGVVPKAVETLVPKVATGAGLGGTFNALNAIGNNESPEDVAKSFGQGAAIGGAGGLVLGGIPLLRKAGNATFEEAPVTATGAVSEPAAATLQKAPGELEVGVSSSTPPVETAPAAAAAPATISTAPVKATAEQLQPANAPVQAPAPVEPTIAEMGGARPANDLQTQIEQAHNAGDTAKVADLINQLEPDMQAPMRNALGIPEPENVQPAGEVPSTAPQAPNAPNVRTALQKQLGTVAKSLEGQQTTHDVLSNPELDTAAQRVVQNMPDDELVNTYRTGAKFGGVADLAQGKAALDRLGKLAAGGNQDAATAIDNILEASEKATSGAGRTLNYAQSFFDTLPKEAKVAYLIRNIDKLRDKAGMPLLKDDLPLQNAVNAKIDELLTKNENLNANQAALEGKIQEIVDRAKAGQATAGDARAADVLSNEAAAQKLAGQKIQGDLAKYYDTLIPKQASMSERSGDLGRTLMLGSVTGRANDIITTGINSLHNIVQGNIESLIGKGLNVGAGRGKFVDTMISPRALVKGSVQGLKKSIGEFRGNVYAQDLGSELRNTNEGGKTQLLRAVGNGPLAKTRRFIRAGAELATNVSQGVKTAELERLSAQEGKQLGLRGDNLTAYTRARAALPSKVMEQNATRLHEEVNNLNDNWISNLFGGVSNAITRNIPFVGEQVKNLTVPFTRWAGGQLYNGVTDKNVIANLVKIGTGVVKGDNQMVVRNVAGLIQNGAGTMTAGYALAKAGLLTTSDPQGYSDNGLYLNIGGHSIPVGFLGFYAPGIVMGYSTYHGLNQPGDKPAIDKIGDVATQTFNSLGRAYLNNTLVGGNNQVLSQLAQVLGGKSNTTWGDVASTTGSQVAGQYIPAITGDINAGLNQTNLNPTHEAANTSPKKINPATGNLITDIKKGALVKVENRVPLLSQSLPRKQGVAANDLIDRVTRGDHASSAEIKAAQDAQTQAQISAQDAKLGIPDPTNKKVNFNDAVEATVQRGNYDEAMAGLQQKLDTQQKDKNIPESKNKALQDQITTLKVLKTGGFDPSIRDLYSKTSLSEWRNMGDPESDTYDPNTYALLYRYDSALAKSGVSASTLSPSDNKYSAKTSKTTGRGSAASKALQKIKSNTIGSTPTLNRVSFGNLAPAKIGVTIPTIQQIQPDQLIKKRTISVSRTR